MYVYLYAFLEQNDATATNFFIFFYDVNFSSLHGAPESFAISAVCRRRERFLFFIASRATTTDLMRTSSLPCPSHFLSYFCVFLGFCRRFLSRKLERARIFRPRFTRRPLPRRSVLLLLSDLKTVRYFHYNRLQMVSDWNGGSSDFSKSKYYTYVKRNAPFCTRFMFIVYTRH